jgi:Protein of unknown function (DUF4238)
MYPDGWPRRGASRRRGPVCPNEKGNRVPMVARRHHYVPKLHLKAFAVPRKKSHQTTVFNRGKREPFKIAIENVAAERDFNRIELDGMAPDAFENGMAGVRLAAVLNKALGKQVAEP